MSFKISAKIERNMATIVLGLATFIAVGILRFPMVWVVCVTVPLSILYFYVMERRNAG